MVIVMAFLASFLVFYLELDYFKVYGQLKNKTLTMDFLIGLAIHVTYCYSLISSIVKFTTQGIEGLTMEFWDIGYELAFFIGCGHYLENKLKLKSSLGIRELLKLQSKKATLVNGNQLVLVNAEDLIVGNLVQVARGETIPTDGILVTKVAHLDYASLLGEAIPREINKGQKILSGAINVGDRLIYQVSKKVSESALMQIVWELEKIINHQSKIELISQKIVKYFLPIILGIATLTFLF